MYLRFSLVLLLGLCSCNGVVKEYNRVLGDTEESKSLSPSVSYSYGGDSLRNIMVPVGGIGTGDILVGGRGNILENEIFGRPCLDESPPYMTFFSVWGRGTGEITFARVLEAEINDDQPNPFGVPPGQLGGLPRFREGRFRTEFPVSTITLKDRDVPVSAELTVWNPFIPLDTRNSSLPLAVFDWSIVNKTASSLEMVLAFNYSNPFLEEYKGEEPVMGMVSPYRENGLNGIIFRLDSPSKAELIILTDHPGTRLLTGWYRGEWRDNAEVFWRSFRENGALDLESEKSYGFTGKEHDVASLLVPVELAQMDTTAISFYVFWRIPEREAENSMSLGNNIPAGKKYTNFYSKAFPGTRDVIRYFFENETSLRDYTQKFHDIMFSSSFPSYVIDAVSSNLASLKSNLISRDGEGRVHAFEGLGNDFGCCPGNCTHVWNYAQSLAFLFPDLERDMRETNFLHDTHPNGYQSFRTVFPPGDFWFRNYAADGQLGTIMRAYREWKFSGDNRWLEKLWPQIKRSLEFSWMGSGKGTGDYAWTEHAVRPWDPGKKGVISGEQHNTYDINFYGPNMLTGALYLGALKAASEMAEAMNEPGKSNEYLEIYESGKKSYEDLLWIGDYYKQVVRTDPGLALPEKYRFRSANGEIVPKYQFGDGCLSDQLLGQFLADISGLGILMDSIHTRRALQSIYRNNFIRNFSDFENVQRIFAMNNEAGLVLCTWPGGNKPEIPFVYADEVWTGVEYQVASGLIYHGLVNEGLEIVKAARDRYRGYNRNPYAEIESGRYYARALSSYGLLTSLSGFEYDGIKQRIKFEPAINRDQFFCFWSTSSAWGYFEIRKKAVFLNVSCGELNIRELEFSHPDLQGVQEINFPYTDAVNNGNYYKISFREDFKLKMNEKLMIGIK